MVVRLVKNEPWRLRSSVMAIAFLNILVFHLAGFFTLGVLNLWGAWIGSSVWDCFIF